MHYLLHSSFVRPSTDGIDTLLKRQASNQARTRQNEVIELTDEEPDAEEDYYSKLYGYSSGEELPDPDPLTNVVSICALYVCSLFMDAR